MRIPTPLEVDLGRPIAGRTLSLHAHRRMLEFGLSRADVEDILEDYEQRYASHSGRFVHQRGPWAVVAQARPGIIVTILRREVERWEH